MFNEYGNPFGATYDHCVARITEMCKAMTISFKELSVVELRALNQCLCNEIDGVFAEAILEKQRKMKNDKD